MTQEAEAMAQDEEKETVQGQEPMAEDEVEPSPAKKRKSWDDTALLTHA